MRRLTRLLRSDEGAVATIVAMLFVFGIMLGLGALTVDVGNINADRRQLQNGADSVALAVAQQCAKGTCNPSDPSLRTLANANAADGATEIRRVGGLQPAICGNAPLLDACPTSPALNTNNPQECPATSLTGTYNYVRVYTETKNAAGQHILPYSFGAAIAGVGSGADQQTCASVAWGPVGMGTSIPFALSACDWKNATTGGAVYASPPPYNLSSNIMDPGWPDKSWEIAMKFNDVKSADCSWGGHDFAGGFGWLCHGSTCTPPTTSLCSIETADGWVDALTGIGASNDCAANFVADVGTVVYVPVFDCINPNKNFCPNPALEPSNGTHTFYHIQGYAAFFMTGIDVDKMKKFLPNYPSKAAQDSCNTKGGKCIYGWFVEGISPTPGAVIDPNAHNFGTTTLQNVG